LESNSRLEEALFAVAADLPTSDRVEFLDRACRENPILRTRIEALLAADADEADFLDASLHTEPKESDPSSSPDDHPEERPGDRLGGYRLLQKIGEGGGGTVYMAEQSEPFKRSVALKVIKLGMDTKAVIARFEIERKALGMMDHPGIARVLDAGVTHTGRPYFVMELVRGIPITQYCDENHLSTSARLELFIQVCQAIQHAHQKGVVHRDIKPSNILVTIHDGSPLPKVIDFGIAKATEGRLTDLTLYTEFHSFVGTPVYSSPEQIEVGGMEVDTRSDIYSLGVVLYELLTGQLPIDKNLSLNELRRSVREEEPARPSNKVNTLNEADLTTVAKRRGTDPKHLVTLLHSDLDWIVMRCLEKDQTRRYETANGLAVDIRRFLSGDPVVARPPSTTYLVKKLITRHRIAFLAGSAVAVALVAGMAVSTWAFQRERKAYERANAEARRSEQVNQLVQEMFRGVDYLVALGRDTKLLREMLDLRTTHLGKLAGQPEVEADLRQTLGAAYFNLGEYTSAEEMFRRELALRQSFLGPEHQLIARSLNDLGAVLLRQNKLAEAEARIREALAMQNRLPVREPAEIAASISNLGVILAQRGQYNEAEAKIREALAIQERSLGIEHPDVAQTLNRLGVVLEQKGRLSDAEAVIREALAMKERLLGPTHPSVSSSLVFLGLILIGQDKYTEAIGVYQRYLKVRSSLGNMDTTITHSRTVSLTERQGTFAEVAAAVSEILRVVEFQHGKESWQAGKYLGGFSWVLLGEEMFVEAEQYARRCLAVRERLRPDDWLTCNARSLIGGALLGQRRTEEAEPYVLNGYLGMKDQEATVPINSKWMIDDAFRRVVRYYEAIGEPLPDGFRIDLNRVTENPE
jgi:serine/threonine protein kinase/Tfp pilus assembly protein PilF